MAQQNPEKELLHHPIQLESVAVKELHINSISQPSQDEPEGGVAYVIKVGRTEYDAASKSISVAVRLETVEHEDPDEENPFELAVEIRGLFAVDETIFPMDKLDRWAIRSAPHLLYPYLREQVYSLTLRCDYNPWILPTVQVPSFKIDTPKEETITD